jgi:choline-sulfatase
MEGQLRRDPRHGLLFLPAGTSAEYPLFVAAGSVLRVERVSPRGAAARLRVSLETDEDGLEERASWDRSAADVAVPLGNSQLVPARLVLTAEGKPGSGVALARPELLAPEPALAAAANGARVMATPAVPPGAAGKAPPDLPASAATRPPNLLIYLVDTLRPDRLGCYGYSRPTSPHLDAFAARATLFEHAVAQSSWTKAAVASIFTSVWPPDHGALGWAHPLPASADTLAERLQAAGYRTAAFVTNPNVTPHFGFDQGFDHFVRTLKTSSEEVNAMVQRWLDQQPADQPFFLYIHTMDPHAPYSPPEPYRTQFAPNWREMPDWQPRWRWPDAALPFLSDLYDGEIAYNDASFGSLVADLERRGLYDDLALVFLSDHGEEFREHGRWRHGNNLHRETLDMPLVVKLPGQRDGRRVAATVQQIDLMPTLLEIAGADAPPAMQGRSLVALAAGRSDAAADPPAHAHLLLGRVPEQLALVDGDWKLLYAPASDGPGTRMLYRWREDPGEERDLAAELPVRTAVLTALLHRRWTEKGQGAAAEVELDAELQKTLRSLGYLQ